MADGSGRVLIGGLVGRNGWQFPQGGIRPEESVEDAMYRELNEELGLVPEDVEPLGLTRDWLRYRLPERFIRRQETPVCVGQKQRWYLLRLLTDPKRVRFDATEAPEFDRCRWVDYWRPVKEVIYFKRQVYVRALNELGPLAFPKTGHHGHRRGGRESGNGSCAVKQRLTERDGRLGKKDAVHRQ